MTQKVPSNKLILWSQAAGYVFVSPGDELTTGLVAGLEFIPQSEYDARMSQVALAVVEAPEALAFTQADVLARIEEDQKYLDHAFVILGKNMEDPQGARTRFARFVTGDFQDEGKNYKAKSLSHNTAAKCFYRFIKDTSYNSHLSLAKDIAIDNWHLLKELLTVECYRLSSTDDVWLEHAKITNMTQKAMEVEGWGWLPRSQIKFTKGKLVIPAWIAQKILDKKEEQV